MTKPIFTQALQICVVVDDLDTYMKSYNDDYGIGPWLIYDFNKDTVSNMTIHGKKVDYSMKLALCNFLNVQWELIEPTSDNSIYAEFLKQHGPGLHHIALGTENYEETIQKLADKGIHEIQGGTWNNLIYSYLDTSKDLGFIAEIYSVPEGFEFPVEKTYPPKK
jgi:methylmalonyl-CoA/ethylmalonyl-CoA epimerase